MIDDMGLTVYEFRLYVHLKRVAGADGLCWQGTRTLAEKCGMSVGMVTKAKEGLAERKLIHIQERDRTKGESDVITIVDIWPQNFAAYAANGPPVHVVNTPPQTIDTRVNAAADPVHVVNTPVHSMNTPVHDTNTPVHAVNERSNSFKNKPSEEVDDDDKGLAPPPAARIKSDDDNAAAFGAVTKAYEKNIGMITEHIGEVLGELMDEIGPLSVIAGIHAASESKVLTFRYIKACALNHHNGIEKPAPAPAKHRGAAAREPTGRSKERAPGEYRAGLDELLAEPRRSYREDDS